jgi:hypothetical protein
MNVAYALIASEAVVYLAVIALGYTAHTEVQSDLPLVISQSHTKLLWCLIIWIICLLIIEFGISLFWERWFAKRTWLGFRHDFRGNKFFPMQALPTESSALQAYVITTVRAEEMPTTTMALSAEIHPEPHHLKLCLVPYRPIHIFNRLVRSQYRDYLRLVLLPLLIILVLHFLQLCVCLHQLSKYLVVLGQEIRKALMPRQLLPLDHLLAPHAFVLTFRALLLMLVQISSWALMIAALAPGQNLGTDFLIVGLEVREGEISSATECAVKAVFVLPSKVLQADRQGREEVISCWFVR